MPSDTHIIVDFGPGLITAIGLFLAAIPGILAAWFAYSNGKAIALANSHLAVALNLHSNPAGESMLTMSPLPPPAPPKE